MGTKGFFLLLCTFADSSVVFDLRKVGVYVYSAAQKVTHWPVIIELYLKPVNSHRI